jgi:hypothetical protein
MSFDVDGNFGGVLTGWKKLITLLNYVVIDLSIWTKFIFKNLGQTFSVINCHGPYENTQFFWDSFFYLQCVKEEEVIIGGELNFTVSRVEVWGFNARLDKVVAYFKHKIEELGYIDVEPLKLTPS